jgi:hypothetical protein
MEDILEVYSRPYDTNSRLSVMEGKPLQLLADSRRKMPRAPGKSEHADCEYSRKGACNIFLFTEPLGGGRFAEATEHRTRIDWAKQIRRLLAEEYPDAQKVALAMDNPTTHNTASLYEAFAPREALALTKRLESHYTQKHGSWLDIAEIELSALGRQCLGSRRINNLDALNTELFSWYVGRNKKQLGVDWLFSTSSARIKLKRLFPIIKQLLVVTRY